MVYIYWQVTEINSYFAKNDTRYRVIINTELSRNENSSSYWTNEVQTDPVQYLSFNIISYQMY